MNYLLGNLMAEQELCKLQP